MAAKKSPKKAIAHSKGAQARKSDASRYTYLKATEDGIVKCVRCGLCRHHCPTFRATIDETKLCRGRIILTYAVEKGSVPLTDKYVELMYLCQNCNTCVAACPTWTPADKIILAGKAEGFKQLDQAKLIAKVFGKGGSTQSKDLWKTVVVDNLPADNVWHKTVSRMGDAAGGESGRGDSFAKLEGAKLNVPAIGAPSDNVLLYIDETSNYIYKDLAQKAIDLLSSLGVQVHVPKRAAASGGFFYMVGDGESSRYLAEKNVESIKEALASAASANTSIEKIITLDPASAWMLSAAYTDLLDEDKIKKEVLTIAEYISKIGVPQAQQNAGGKDICGKKTVVLASGVIKNRFKRNDVIPGLLKTIGAHLWPLGDADRVYGDEFGVVPTVNEKEADQVGMLLANALEEIKPDIVVVQSPQLKMQLDGKIGVPVKHIVELL